MNGPKRVRVSFTPELQAEMDEDGFIRIITLGISYPLRRILAELVRAWVRHYGIQEMGRDENSTQSH